MCGIVAAVRHPELEAAIRGRPDELEPRLAFAEWLTSVGDPHGELIRVEAQMLGAPIERVRELTARRTELLLARFPVRSAAIELIRNERWRVGFVDELALCGSEGLDPLQLLSLFDEAAYAFITTLRLEPLHVHPARDHEITRILVQHLASRAPTIRTLALVGQRHSHSARQLGDLSDLLDPIPGLTSLDVQGTGYTASRAVVLPELRSLDLDYSPTQRELLAALDAPSLVRLSLLDEHDLDGLAIWLAPRLGRITSLVARGRLGDRGAAALAGALPPGARLQLSKGSLTAQSQAAFAAAGVVVECSSY